MHISGITPQLLYDSHEPNAFDSYPFTTFFVHNSAGCEVKTLRQVENLVVKQSSCLCKYEIELSLPWRVFLCNPQYLRHWMWLKRCVHAQVGQRMDLFQVWMRLKANIPFPMAHVRAMEPKQTVPLPGKSGGGKWSAGKEELLHRKHELVWKWWREICTEGKYTQGISCVRLDELEDGSC